MAKLGRFTQKLFGNTSGANTVSEFGSFAAGTSARFSGATITPTLIQSLSNWASGWASAIVGADSPAIEDMEAVCYLFAFQLAYLFQTGIAEWDSGTTYFIGSIVTGVGTGTRYKSLTDNNLNNVVTSAANWVQLTDTATVTRFTQNGTWVCPANVTNVVIRTKKNFAFMSTCEQVGGDQVLALDVFGNCYSWGNNQYGQLGNNADVTPRSSPILVTGGFNFQKVLANAFQSVGLASNGKLYMWGQNSDGELGSGAVVSLSIPTLVLGGILFRDVFSCAVHNGGESYYAVTPNGTSYAWGINDKGQLGLGDLVPRSSPVLIAGGALFQIIIPGTNRQAFGLNFAGTAFAWGQNDTGQLGTGNTTFLSSPVQVVGGLTFQQIAIGGSATYFLSTAGAAYACGQNPNGELGVGDTTTRSSPVLVLGGLTFSRLFSSNYQGTYAYALDANGKAYAWGLNGNGQLGVGDVASRSSPVAVLGGLSFVKLYPTNTQACFGITNDGTLYGWGLNANGELGLGDVIPRSSPVAVLGGLKFVDMINGKNYNLGILGNGMIYGWGLSAAGCVGVGDITPRSSPVVVVGPNVYNPIPTLNSINVPVTAGVTYTITIQQFLANFGKVVVGQNYVDELSVEYVS